jgi:hypothetical protein
MGNSTRINLLIDINKLIITQQLPLESISLLIFHHRKRQSTAIKWHCPIQCPGWSTTINGLHVTSTLRKPHNRSTNWTFSPCNSWVSNVWNLHAYVHASTSLVWDVRTCTYKYQVDRAQPTATTHYPRSSAFARTLISTALCMLSNIHPSISPGAHGEMYCTVEPHSWSSSHWNLPDAHTVYRTRHPKPRGTLRNTRTTHCGWRGYMCQTRLVPLGWPAVPLFILVHLQVMIATFHFWLVYVRWTSMQVV